MGSMPEKFAAAQKAYAQKIKTFARNSAYAVPGMDEADMEQELLVVLWNCCFEYHPSGGATFNTFFQRSAKNKIATLIRGARRQKRSADVTSLDIDEVRILVDNRYTAESPETIVERRIIIREVAAAEGTSGVQQILRTDGMSGLLAFNLAE